MSDLLGMFKRVMGVPQDDMEPYEEEEYEDGGGYYRQQAYSQYGDRGDKNSRSSANERPSDRNDRYRSYGQPEKSKVVDFMSELGDMEVAVKKPSKYDEARIVCDKLKAFAPVIVNLERLNKEEAQRVVDFIMGACYTMDGHVEEIKEDVFLVAPSMVTIEKEASDEVSTAKSSSFFSRFSF